MERVILNAVHRSDVAIVLCLLPEITLQRGRKGLLGLGACHCIAALNHGGGDVPDLHRYKDRQRRDGTLSLEAGQRGENNKHQQIVYRPEQPSAGAKNGKQPDQNLRQRQGGQRGAVCRDDICHREYGQDGADDHQSPVLPQTPQPSATVQYKGNGQRHKDAQAQISKGVIVSVNLIQHRKDPTVTHTVYPHRIPQCVEVHREIPIQRLPTAGRRAVKQSKTPAQPQGASQIRCQIKSRSAPVSGALSVFQQQRQRNSVGHR